VGERCWARRLLEWRAGSGPLVMAEISAARYFVRGDRHEVLAWCEVRGPGGRYRVEIGSLCVGPAGALAVVGGVLLHRRSSHSPSRGHWRKKRNAPAADRSCS
jgi:hypothetical protein